MLTEQSYVVALGIYLLAGLATSAGLGWWVKHHFSFPLAIVSGLLVAALLMTPAYPGAEVKTFAPALVVLVFTGFTQGWDQVSHALRPLGVALAIAMAAAVVVLLGAWLMGSRRTGDN